MTFREKFDRYACEGDAITCEGDAITCEVDGFEITARIVRDDCLDAPDERQDGFWPSLYLNDPGFIGAGNNFRERFAKAQAKAEAVMQAWRDDDWFYCGIVLSVDCEGVELEPHAASLWGVEVNYPGSDNTWLTEVADELLPEALDAARAALARLLASQPARTAKA